jgi:hypothetical protein
MVPKSPAVFPASTGQDKCPLTVTNCNLLAFAKYSHTSAHQLLSKLIRKVRSYPISGVISFFLILVPSAYLNKVGTSERVCFGRLMQFFNCNSVTRKTPKTAQYWQLKQAMKA